MNTINKKKLGERGRREIGKRKRGREEEKGKERNTKRRGEKESHLGKKTKQEEKLKGDGIGR